MRSSGNWRKTSGSQDCCSRLVAVHCNKAVPAYFVVALCTSVTLCHRIGNKMDKRTILTHFPDDTLFTMGVIPITAVLHCSSL